jgi:glucose 1-dehydrogenase
MGARLEQRAAIVTGAGEGIGQEIARRLALHGASVVLNDLDGARAEQAAEAVRREGGECVAEAGDAGDPAFARRLVDVAVERFGRIDFVVANAGITHWCGFFDYEPEDFQRVVQLNLAGSFFLAQAGARCMREQGGGGRILLMSSILGERAVPNASVYGMTKAGLRMLARGIAVEVAPFGITVNVIAPGATVTPRTLREEPDYEETWQRLTPLGRAGRPGDIAEAALYFLSPEAAHVTGQTLTVDGGWSFAAQLS